MSQDEKTNGQAEARTRELLESLLGDCIGQDASDLHLAGGDVPFLRVHGVIEPREAHGVVTSEQMWAMAKVMAGRQDMGALQANGALDGAVTAADGTRFRFNVYRRGGDLSMCLRRLNDGFKTLEQLGLPEALYRLCDVSDGLVIVAGPTGSGKSTTLATLLDRINRDHAGHIVTIEDPIEYVHKRKKSLVNQRQVGMDVKSFNDALVAALRQDPDVILVGEIRDLETIRTAVTAAETGHLVFATVHAGDCVSTIERIVSVFPADEQTGIRRQLAMTLRAVIAQHLLVADGSAGHGSSKPGKDGSLAPVKRGRTIVSEVMFVTPAVANLIANAKGSQIYSVMESGTAQGMQTMEQDLARLWVAGKISEETAMGMARNPGVVRDRAAMMKRPAGMAGAGVRR